MKAMKIIREFIALTAILIGMTCWAGDSVPFLLDTTDPLITAPITYNSSWVGGDSSAEVVISDDGTEIKRTTGEGEFMWSPTTAGKHTLTYTTYINGVAQEEVYTATVYADWKYTVEDGKATIVETTQKSGSVTIPSKIDGFPVVGLGDGLFDGCEGLTSVTIPDSVASVGTGAFNGCTGIRSVSLSPTFKIRSFNSGLIQAKFNSSDDFTSSIIDSESKSLVSGVLMGDAYDTESVTRTYTDPKYGGSYQWNRVNTTFGYAGYMYMVEGRTYVFGKYFDDSVLVRIDGIEVLKNTDHTAFATGKYIPVKTGWHEIEVRVADGTGEKGPKGVASSGYWSGTLGVGWRDDGITDALPESGWKKMMDPGDGSLFRSSEAFEDLTLKSLFPDSYAQLTNVTLIGTITEIPDGLFAGCAALESFVIPDSVTKIGANAFAGCASLQDVVIPDGVTTIGVRAFDGCSGLASVTTPDSVTSIGDYAFEDCVALTEIIVRDSVIDIGIDAFTGCTNLTNVMMPARFRPQFGDELNGCPITYIAEIQIGNGIWPVMVGDDPIVLGAPFVAPTDDVVIPSEIAGRPIVGITADAFAGNGDITGIHIPDSVTDIEEGAFDGCTGIRSVRIPYVTDESQWMAKYFSDSYANITNVVLGGSVGRIGDSFFTGCEALSSVSLPAGLTNIARTAFSGCSNIAEVTWCATNIWTENVILPRPINVVKIFRNRWGQFLDENDNPINNSYISPRISDNMSTNMWAEVYFEEGGEYTFSWYVRSQENCDFLNLYVDGQYVDGISGYMRTRQAFTVELSPGEHILTWAYEKDGSVSKYSDRSYIYADEMNEFDDCKMGFGELFADSKASLRVLSFAEGVVSLPDGCLTRLEAVERVELPSTLEKFGDNDLRSLSKVENGFWIEQGWVLGYMGTASGTVEIPEGVKGIASYAFERQTLLDNVTLPSTLKYVGVNAFKSCTNLEDIDLPEGVVRVEDGAFRNCTYAQTVKLPSSLQEIGDSAFENCTSFSGVECPESLRFIGGGAFSNCWRMLSVSLPVGLESVGTNAFLDCRRLIGVSTPTHLNTMKELFPSAYANLATIEIADTENTLVPRIFAECSSLTEVKIPEGIRLIPEEAFVGCLAVQSFNLPNTITNIGARAFSGLTQMTSFAFPAEVETIADEAFAGCVNLASLSLPEGVKHIGSRAFDGLALLARADIPGTVVEMGEAPFAGCGQIRAVSIPGNVATVKSLFPDAYGEIVSASVTVGTTCVGERLFADCSKLTSVDLPSTLVEIGECAFENCALLADAGVPAGVERLGESAFLNCASLAKIALPNGLVTVPYQAFAGCEALAEIVIPENVSELDDSVFWGCSRLSKVYFVGNAPSCTASSYDGVPASLVTYVENGSTGWDGIETSKTLPEFWPEGTSNLITYWTPNRYDVTFDLSGGGDAFDVEQVTGTTYILPADPERQGAVFDGWWTSADGGARVTAVTSVDLTRPHTFYARWKYNTYSVVFDANGGSGEMDEQRLTVETSAQLAENGFTRPGYAFLGWATEPEGEAVYLDKAEVVNLAYDNNAIVTLYAVWSEREWTWADAVNATSSGLVFSGDVNNDAEWAIDHSTSHDGVASLRSGVIGASAEYPERTMSTVKTEVVGEGAGEFWWKVNCEEMDAEYDEWYDYVVFTIDGEEVAKIAGDSGWQKVEYAVTGAGKHILAWTFTRDDYDEEGVVWENAAWLDEFVWTPNPVTVTFDAGGADGDVPDPVVKYAGYELTLPGAGTLNNGEYVFRGWSDGETTYQAGSNYVFGLDNVTLTAVWELKVWTLAEAADAEGLVLTTGGDADWTIDGTSGYTNAMSVKSGVVVSGQESWIETKINGSGTLTFRWKVMGGQYRNTPFAYAKVVVDDTEVASEYLTDGWEEVVYEITGNKEHTIRWTYLRTSTRAADGDCAWIDAVVWTPSASSDITVDVDGDKNVVVPVSWVDKYESIVTAAGGDKAAALQRTAANGRKVWECFMLGVDPTKADDDFKITRFWMEGGKPMFEFSHSTDGAGNSFTPRIKMKGKAKLTDGWSDVPAGGDSSFRFFTVEVALP